MSATATINCTDYEYVAEPTDGVSLSDGTAWWGTHVKYRRLPGDASMSIHPEDAMAYAEQLHRDCAAIADELAGIREGIERLGELIALVIDGERAIAVREYVPLRERRA